MAARKKSPTNDTALGQADPKAPLSSSALLAAATPVLRALTEDLRERADSSPAMTLALRQRHAQERKDERTAEAYEPWRRAFVEQVAASWFLGCVFVRTLEDRGLVDRNRIAGPGALDSQRAFFALFPSLSERDYLLSVFRELTHLPAAEDLFDPRHNPLWLLGPSAEAVQQLLQLFRTPSAEEPSFRFGAPDTRFLGDLYQDLSEDVRKRYALLQTPAFIERFILDRTLEPAIERFGLDDTNVIDPTCGSGHFLLGAFDRLFNHRLLIEPGLAHAQAAKIALEAVAGSDINPYAVAIARFRLTLSFLDKASLTRLRGAPKLPLNVVVADSLLYNPQRRQQELGHIAATTAKAWLGAELSFEDEDAARRVLHRQYAAVVGNPPYITVKDAVLRERYRKMYSTAYREYSVAVPFKERFFQLARDKGYVGMITANSFMKREFGKKLITDYLGTVNLQTVVNTSGAFIPGHGTPTVLLFGTAEPPQEDNVLTVLASRGEPATPEDPELGLVWSSIAQHWPDVGFEDEYISVVRTPRATLCRHPWSLGGGGALELKEQLEKASERSLGDLVDSVGFMCITKQDDVFSQLDGVLERLGVSREWIRSFAIGENIRDWTINSELEVVFPYAPGAIVRDLPAASGVAKFLWNYRTVLESRAVFGGSTFREAGREWWSYGQIPKDRTEGAAITFAFVATHNHFVLDKGGKVFKQSAPIIKLPESATEDDHYALLAYLNSSTACFWMKQVFYPKGRATESDHPDPCRNRYEYAGTGLEKLPLPNLDTESRNRMARWARELTALGERRSRLLSTDLKLDDGKASIDNICAILDAAWKEADRLRRRMVWLQEEIDWEVYRVFGLIDSDTSIPDSQKCDLTRGQRSFEVKSGRVSFVRRGGELVPPGEAEVETAPPTELTDAQQASIAVRQKLTQASPFVAMLEAALYKRLWRDSEANEPESEFRARHDVDVYRAALLRPIEQSFIGHCEVQQLSWLRPLAGKVESQSEAVGLKLADAISDEAVPYCQVFRYTDAGLEKYSLWERTWDLQRSEDAAKQGLNIPVPPKYEKEDFRSSNYWSLRGKLDVPKERFISYPGCESDEDNEPVYGWAGWDHLQRAQALVGLYQQRKSEGWKSERLTPMLAGMLELLPWLKQWHSEPDPNLDGARPSEQFEALLSAECALHGLTQEDLRAWPPAGRKGGKATRAVALPPPVEEPVKGEAAPAAAPKAPRKKRKADDDRQPELNFKSEKSS